MFRPPLPARGAPDEEQPLRGRMPRIGSRSTMGAANGPRPLQPSPSWDAASWDGWDDEPGSGADR